MEQIGNFLKRIFFLFKKEEAKANLLLHFLHIMLMLFLKKEWKGVFIVSNIHHIKVYFGDTDAAGIVYYPNYYRWMDQAAHEFFRAKGYALSELQTEKNIIVPLVEANCSFKQPLFYEDEVEVHTKVSEIKNKILKLEHRFVREDEEIAAGYEIRAWTKKQEDFLRAETVPEHIIDILKA